MKIISIIPARMGSSRFPNKPMKKINGIPMIGHVYYRVDMSKILSETYVATCDKEIFDYIESINGKAIMTSPSHERASDRTAEAMLKIEKLTQNKIDIVVMVQGDEPLVTPKMINQALEPIKKDSNIKVVNLMAEIKTIDEFENPNEIKVIVDSNSDAIYLSREPIPSRKKCSTIVPMYKQVCIIPFQRDYLLKFNSIEEGPLEKIESIDMLRIIENMDKVRMIKTEEKSISVDTKEDLVIANQLMKNDKLVIKYLSKIKSINNER